MKTIRQILYLICGMSVGACQAVTPPAQAPARLRSPSKEVRQQLQDIVAKSLGVGAVTLAENTLTDSSQFSYARTPRRDSSGQLLQGRVIEPAHVFRLQIRGQECWLIYQNTGQQTLLQHAECVAE
ncbi:MAG: hypothetical protein HYZ65_09680 [Burkholderiales bacterium]|nr:hypothetical protein [Burkholderiales bacterium]